MKKIVSLILGLLTIICFLFIAASYHSRIEDNFLRYYLEIFKNFTFSDFRKSFTGIYKQNFTIPFWENLFGLILLFISILLNKKYLILFSSLLLMVLWIKNYVLFGGIMDSNLYFKTSIPFFILILVLNIFNFLYKDKSVSNS